MLQPPRSLIPLLLLVAALALGGCGDQPSTPETRQGPPQAEDRQGSLEPPAEPEQPLLELSYAGGMIANPDPTPFVRVYPGGRVLVHYPVYMKKAGDYELQLSDEEVEALLASFSNEAVLRLEESDLLAMRAAIKLDSTEPVIGDHGVESVVRVHGESFTPQGADRPALIDIDRTIRVPNDLLRAAPESGFSNLQNLADGVRQLEQLARSESLQKIDG